MLMIKRLLIISGTGLVLTLSMIIVSCGCGNKSEREQYEAATSGFKYNSYKSLSEKALLPLCTAYNNQIPDSLKVRDEIVRLLLGYFWITSGKTSYGFAEGNIILEKSDDETFKSLAHLLISVGMFENGWKDLAKEESGTAINLLSKNPEGKYVKFELTVVHLLMATFSVYNRDFESAKFHLAGFGLLTGINWPYQLADAMNDVENGDLQEGLKKIKSLSKDQSVPSQVRTSLQEAIAEVEKTTGDVDSALFWPRAISGALYGELKNASQPGIEKAMNLLDKAQESVDIF